ncbi:MAG: polymer-forming cytoskeletal protein [Eubacterium sp.]|jgi:cytoskeletal protein CcmA (bactofilin family)|nr:polymer-forming cytoskeletal protein [Eubacterium sp.]
MGLKENFAQAVKELTGGKKEDAASPVEKKGVDIEKIRRAIEVEQPDRDLGSFSASLGSGFNGTPESGNLVLSKNSKSDAAETVPVITPTNFDFGYKDKSSYIAKDYNKPNLDSGYTSNVPSVGESYPGFTPSNPNPYAAKPDSPDYSLSVPPNDDYPGYSQPNQNPSSPLTPIPGIPKTTERRFTSDNGDNEITVISKNTVVNGNIRSFANMSIDGDIKGDVETTKDIDLNGKIVGNITCNNAEMHISQIQGNVRMKGHIEMGRDTLLIGDIVSTFARLNGKVKGNIDVAGKAELKSDSVVFGDISASTITVDDGAIIQGYVSTTFLNKDESRNIFPDSVMISGEGS